MYWNIDQIYEALLHDIPKEKMFEWYRYSLNKMELNETKHNLVSYCKGSKVYTEEEQKEDEERIKEAFRLLQESI